MLSRASDRIRATGALSLAPGLIDAGFGSLAGLTGALYAARFFDLGQLGLFSLFFVVFQLLGPVPARLLLVPAQVVALDMPVAERASVLARSLPTGLVAGLLTLPFVWIVVPLAPEGDRADFIAFGITTSTMVLLSPLQDHVRFMLHMSERSPAAAAVSVVQFAVAIIGLVAMHLLDVPARWIPFLSLSIANGASLGFGVAMARPRLAADRWPGARKLLRSGRLLLPAALLPWLGTLGAAALVARLASTDALGSAEAARVVASPVLVAGTGLGQVLWPRIMASARNAQIDLLASTARLYTVVVLLITLGYIAVVGWPHPLNPMEALVPLAFTVGGLVAFRTVAAASTVVANIPASALLGMEDNRSLLIAAIASLFVQLAVAAVFASAIGAHAVPAAQLVGSITGVAILLPRIRGLIPALRRW